MQVIDDVLVAVALFTRCNIDLRASLRHIISSSDVSETGRGASEARARVKALDRRTVEVYEGWKATFK